MKNNNKKFLYSLKSSTV